MLAKFLELDRAIRAIFTELAKEFPHLKSGLNTVVWLILIWMCLVGPPIVALAILLAWFWRATL